MGHHILAVLVPTYSRQLNCAKTLIGNISDGSSVCAIVEEVAEWANDFSSLLIILAMARNVSVI